VSRDFVSEHVKHYKVGYLSSAEQLQTAIEETNTGLGLELKANASDFRSSLIWLNICSLHHGLQEHTCISTQISLQKSS